MVNNGRTAFLSAPVVLLAEWRCRWWSTATSSGSVGVSGVTAAQDAQIASVGVAALAN